MHPTSLISVQFSYHFSGVTPAEAEMNYLNTAKMLDLYGVDIHTVMVSYRNTVFILLVQETIEVNLIIRHCERTFVSLKRVSMHNIHFGTGIFTTSIQSHL